MSDKIQKFIDAHKLVTDLYQKTQQLSKEINIGQHAGAAQIHRLAGIIKQQKAAFDIHLKRLASQFKDVDYQPDLLDTTNKRSTTKPVKKVGRFLEDSIFNHSTPNRQPNVANPPKPPKISHKGISGGKDVAEGKEQEQVHTKEMEQITTTNMIKEKEAQLQNLTAKYKKLSKAAREREAGQKKQQAIQELQKELQYLATKLAEQKKRN